MNAMTDDAIRLLNAMGIDVWYARAALGQAAPSSPDISPDIPTSTAVQEPAHPASSGSAPSVPERSPVRQPVATSVAPFTVLCLARDGAMLLIETADPRAARRFAADLLAAVTGVWGGETRQLRFEWPQPGIAPSADAVARALGAFVGKQLGDHEGALVLAGREVADRLAPGVLPADCVLLPPFDVLMTDGALKRTLWQDVGSRRSR